MLEDQDRSLLLREPGESALQLVAIIDRCVRIRADSIDNAVGGCLVTQTPMLVI